MSAGHVVRDATAGSATLAIQNGVPGAHVIPLASRPFYTPAQDDPFDLAVWPLEPQTVAELSKAKKFVNQSSIQWLPDMRVVPGDLFYLCGFPTQLAGIDPADDHHIILEPIRWIAGRCTDSGRLPSSVDPQYHIALDERTAIRIDVDDRDTKPPAVPEGISGCGIWRVDAKRMMSGTWQPKSPRLVAIQTCAYPKASIIRGTG